MLHPGCGSTRASERLRPGSPRTVWGCCVEDGRVSDAALMKEGRGGRDGGGSGAVVGDRVVLPAFASRKIRRSWRYFVASALPTQYLGV